MELESEVGDFFSYFSFLHFITTVFFFFAIIAISVTLHIWRLALFTIL